MFGYLMKPMALREAANEEARKVTERWDVPHTVEVDGKVFAVAPDIDDRSPRYQGTQDGRRISERLMLEDTRTGGPSPAVPLLIAVLPMLMMVAQIFAAITLFKVALLCFVLAVGALGFVWRATQSWAFAVMCAILMAMTEMSSLPSMSGLSRMLPGLPIYVLLGFLLLVGWVTWVRGGAHALRALLWGAGCIALIAFLAAHSPSWLQPVVLFVPLCLLPVGWAFYENSRWAGQCYEQGLLCQGE